MYINVGAFVDGKRAATKKALTVALRDAPDTVRFDATSELGTHWRGQAKVTEALADERAGATLQVTGPDPYTSRKWYASVTRNAETGKVTVK